VLGAENSLQAMSFLKCGKAGFSVALAKDLLKGDNTYGLLFRHFSFFVQLLIEK